MIDSNTFLLTGPDSEKGFFCIRREESAPKRKNIKSGLDAAGVRTTQATSKKGRADGARPFLTLALDQERERATKAKANAP